MSSVARWVPILALLAACASPDDQPAGAKPPAPTAEASRPAPPETKRAESQALASAADVAAKTRGDLSCPPEVGSAPRSPDAPVDDVLGVRPGLTYEEAANTILCSHDLLVIKPEKNRGFRVDTHGHEIRQGFTARFAEREKSSDEILAEMRDSQMARSLNSRVEDLEAGEAKWFVGTMGVPNEERVIHVAREEWFVEGKAPSMETVESALVDKYGTPTKHEEVRGTLELTWAYDPLGRLITESSPLFNRCRGAADPDRGFNLSADCGTVVSAAVAPTRDNPRLSRSLQVGVVDQAYAFTAIEETEQALQRRESERQTQEIEEAAKNADAPQL